MVSRRFWLEGSNDGEAWTVVGASVYMDMVWGGFGMFDYQFGTTAERNTVQIVGVYEYVRIVNMLQVPLLALLELAVSDAAFWCRAAARTDPDVLFPLRFSSGSSSTSPSSRAASQQSAPCAAT
eukprot:627065-Rhodomonas_salina.3